MGRINLDIQIRQLLSAPLERS